LLLVSLNNEFRFESKKLYHTACFNIFTLFAVANSSQGMDRYYNENDFSSDQVDAFVLSPVYKIGL
jgi:hypothetical protein